MNSKLILLLTLIFIVAACNDKRKKSVEDSVHPSDTTCIREIARAKKDLKNNKLVYCNYVGGVDACDLRSCVLIGISAALV
jgi:hypothetical protein